ncbi:unnamed protein product [Rotaria socialis]
MRYAQDNDKVLLIDSPYMPASQPLSLTDDPEIRRTRKILLILLSGILVLAVLGTIGSITGNGVTNNSEYSSRGVQIGRSLISVVFLSFGYLVAHRYSKIGLLVVLAVLGTIGSIAGNGVTNNFGYSSRGVQIGRSLISVVFLSFGYLVAHRYSKIGLLVFAWLNIIGLVISGIVVMLLFVLGLVSLTNPSSVNNTQAYGILIGESIVFFVVIVIIIAAFILQIVIVKFAFKLARLIEANKSSFRQQI